MTESVIGILGVGRLGEAVAEAMLSLPGLKALLVTRRGAERVRRLGERDRRVRPADPEEILRACDDVIVVLGPEAARTLLPSLTFERRHHLVSMMAEVGIAELKDLAEGAGSVCRVLALPAVAHGGQPLPVYPVTAAAERLLGAKNNLIALKSEPELLAFWTITGLLSSVMMIGEVAARWLEGTGVGRTEAETYARILFSEVHGLTGDGFERALEHVSTPGGLNVMMAERLRRAGFERQVSEGLDEISRRLLRRIGETGAETVPTGKPD